MRFARTTIAVFLVVILSGLLPAQQVPTLVPQRNPQAIAIAAQSLSSMTSQGSFPAGGVIAVGSISVTGIGTGPLPIRLKTMGPRTLRTEIDLPAGLNVLIVNNGNGVIQKPNGSTKQLQLYTTMAMHAEFIPALSTLTENANPQYSVRLLDDAVIQGQATTVVEFNLEAYSGKLQEFVRAATCQRFYISKSSGLVLALEYDSFAENDSDLKSATQVLYSDYRLVGGIWVPFSQTTSVDGSVSSVLTLSSVDFSSTVSSTDFQLPTVSQ